MVTRRTSIRIGVAAGTGTLTSASWAANRLRPHARMLAKASMLDPASLTKFMDPLPILPVLKPTSMQDGMPIFDIATRQFKQQLHTLWGYAGQYPGPTLEARVASRSACAGRTPSRPSNT